MGKSSKAEKERRLNEVFQLVLNGATRYQILQFTAKAYQLKTRQTDAYIQEANALLASEAEFHRARELGRSIARLNDIYMKTRAANDYGHAIAVIKELNSLLALNEAPATPAMVQAGLTPALLVEITAELQRHNIKLGDLIPEMTQELKHAKSK